MRKINFTLRVYEKLDIFEIKVAAVSSRDKCSILQVFP